METNSLLPHLFRTEFSKITSVLCKFLSAEHIELAEDIASETFLLALETWTYNGLPENPTAWLYTVAKNKAKNHINRRNLFANKIAAGIKELREDNLYDEIDLSESNINDSQLQMLFAICHPTISVESQVSLALRILCGFGIDEIANAFLTNKETINKRIFRAKEKLRQEKIQIEFPPKFEIDNRLNSVLITLYLLFSEGYYSESNDAVLREELCEEAIKLTTLLIENTQTNVPAVNALLSLMCFQSSRFAARKNDRDELILYEDQDEALWNQGLIAKGVFYLKQATKDDRLTKYHLEATIAYWHTVKIDTKEKWENILQLYNHLLQIEYSPVAALNRTYALSKTRGKAEAIAEAEKLNLKDNHFYFALLADLYIGIDIAKVRANLELAYSFARTQKDKQTIQRKISRL